LILKYIILLFSLPITILTLGQDVRTQPAGSLQSPNSGCGLAPALPVTINVNNNSGVVMFGNTITASYRIDGGPIVSQLVSPIIAAGATITFTFTVQANLSACGPHTVKAWAKRPGDLNPSNDTILWTVQNDCPITPGAVNTTDTVCSTGNSGTVNLTGSVNGTITSWQTSTNGGMTWNPLPVTTPSYSYLNLSTTTLYRVLLEGGFCVDTISAPCTLLVETPPSPGVLSGPVNLCSTSASGTLSVTGSSLISKWQSSTNSGLSWDDISNTTNSFNFSGLTQSTQYRVEYGSSACGFFYSNIHTVNIENAVTLADVSSTITICESAGFGSLNAVNVTTSINYWQSSTNGISWTNIPITTLFHVYSGLTQSTFFRFNLNGVYCPASFSDTCIVNVQAAPVLPSLSGGGTFCETSVLGSINATGATASVIQWQSSTNGGMTWSSIPNTTYNQSYSGIGQTTQYRIQIEGSFCPDAFSLPITITVDSVVNAGSLSGSDSLCFNSISGTIVSNLTTLSPAQWQSSLNGTSWLPFSNPSTSYSLTALSQSTYYRLFIEGGACPDAYSDTAFIFVDQFDAGNLTAVDSVCDVQTNFEVNWVGIGNVLNWQYSIDNGLNWTTLSDTNTELIIPSLSETTLFQANVSGYICPAELTSVFPVYLESLSNAGILKEDLSICFGENAPLELTGFTADSIRWEVSEDGILFTPIDGNAASNTILDVTESLYVQVIVQNGICPSAISNQVEIMVLPLPSISVFPDTTINEGDTAFVTAVTSNAGGWSPITYMTDYSLLTTGVFPISSTDYLFTVTDPFGCVNSDTASISVIPSEEFEICNVLTLNGDEYNNVWVIKGLHNFPETKVSIFNLYGKQLFESDDYQNDWDGTNKGKELPNGNYYYVVIQGTTEKQFKGTILLMGME
jgi:gliding motility-associated-like protein